MEQKNIEQRFKRLSIWLAGLTIFTLGALGFLATQVFKESPKGDFPIKIYNNMKLTQQNLRDVFTPMDQTIDPNTIKQVYYGWFENRTNEYGLLAFGVNEKGEQISDRVKLTIPNVNDYQTNWHYDTEPIMINTRGQLKYLLGSQNLDQDVPIEGTKMGDITFTPLMRSYPGTTSTMFFELRASTPGISILANPAPPFSFTCTKCDGRQ